MRQKSRRFLTETMLNQTSLCILCIMAVITSLITVMPVSAEEETLTEDVKTSETVSGSDVLPAALTAALTNEAVALIGTELAYTDEQGNFFTYEVNAEENAIITGITVSGAALTIPEAISDAPVIAVANGSSCVVSNPTVAIPELTINCNTVGVKAFSGLSIGTLVIGEEVKEFSVSNDGDYSFQFFYEQFAESNVDKVVFNAVELNVGYYTGDSLHEF